jgi:hypothetical protein
MQRRIWIPYRRTTGAVSITPQDGARKQVAGYASVKHNLTRLSRCPSDDDNFPRPAAGGHRGVVISSLRNPQAVTSLGCALRIPHSFSPHRCHPLNVHATSLSARDRVAIFCLSTCAEQQVKAYAIRSIFVFLPFWTYTASHGDFLGTFLTNTALRTFAIST